MNIKNEEFEAIKSELLQMYFMARDYGDIYVMENCDTLLSFMQGIENRDIKKRQLLKK